MSLSASTTYDVYVQAHNVAGVGAASATVSQVTDPATVPGSPTIDPGTSTARTITITWTAPVETGGTPILGYNITLTTPEGTFSDYVTTNSYQFTGLDPGETYSYTVSAVNAQGDSTAASDTFSTICEFPSLCPHPIVVLFSFSLFLFRIPKVATAPSAPYGVTVSASSTASITLTWSAPMYTNNASITGYTVSYVLAVGTSLVTQLNATSSTLAVTGLTPLTGYNFTVYATNEVGNSPNSALLSATTLGDLLGKRFRFKSQKKRRIQWFFPPFSFLFFGVKL